MNVFAGTTRTVNVSGNAFRRDLTLESSLGKGDTQRRRVTERRIQTAKTRKHSERAGTLRDERLNRG